MTTTAPTTGTAPENVDDVIDELHAWLEENWDPDLTVAQWWERLGLAGWSLPSLPGNAYGRDLSRAASVRVAQEISSFGALGAPGGLGLLLAAPTIATHGTQEQIDLYVKDIVTGQKAWCQLFSEPGAGSDLAGLTSRAVEDGEEFVVTGQKVWTSMGHHADLGMLIARTAPELPKHQGITYFALDMHQPGVEVRPLKEMTGHAMFNEVFMEEARVHSSAIIGRKNDGWAVTNTTLMHERAGLGAGGGGGGGFGAVPGTVAGHLERRAGDYVTARRERRPKSTDNGEKGATGDAAEKKARKRRQVGLGGMAKILADFARPAGKLDDPTVRQDLMRLHTLNELGRYNGDRSKAARSTGKDIPGMANIAKLQMSNIVRLQRDLGLRILGPSGMLHAYDDQQKKALDEATGNPFLSMVTTSALYAQAPPIYGGTDQIQRNIIGERVLGLPKEPNDDRVKPFSELPKNA